MRPTGRLLEHTIHALFTTTGIAFLRAIYMHLRDKRIVKDAHLAPFLTLERIKQYRTWYS